MPCARMLSFCATGFLISRRVHAREFVFLASRTSGAESATSEQAQVGQVAFVPLVELDSARRAWFACGQDSPLAGGGRGCYTKRRVDARHGLRLADGRHARATNSP